jgi:hypothetical protein
MLIFSTNCRSIPEIRGSVPGESHPPRCCPIAFEKLKQVEPFQNADCTTAKRPVKDGDVNEMVSTTSEVGWISRLALAFLGGIYFWIS